MLQSSVFGFQRTVAFSSKVIHSLKNTQWSYYGSIRKVSQRTKRQNYFILNIFHNMAYEIRTTAV